jgi:Zn-dependent protease
MFFPMLNDSTLDMGLWIILLIFSCSVHESAHAWVAYRCGDDTGKNDGRISLNPMVHISLIDSILLPVLLLISTEGRFILGGAKPVIINPSKLRNPERDMTLSAVAGPLSNLLLVVVATLLLLVVKAGFYAPNELFALMRNVILNLISLNLILVFFNLLPIPPLDGARVFRYLVPAVRGLYDRMDDWGLAILILLMVCVPEIFQLMASLTVWVLTFILYLYYLV